MSMETSLRASGAADPDGELQNAVFAVESAAKEAALGVTLVVQGAVVTGELISSHEYFLRYGEQVTSRVTPEIKQAIMVTWNKKAEAARAAALRRTLGEPRFDYAHLRNARFLMGTALQPPYPAGLLMRVRLSEVAAFSLGTIGPM